MEYFTHNSKLKISSMHELMNGVVKGLCKMSYKLYENYMELGLSVIDDSISILQLELLDLNSITTKSHTYVYK